ncbi:MAG TPA: gliding motility-associated ABC transporter ATP-binding subunit GldA [Flammeovirgaceae bacterium]|nr:gliding motility-associated ABC transporter ATP-binding subunit GldA [Flammeovirgaceae bacterium]
MSIEVSGLTRIYGRQKAVDNLSFRVEKDEIVGFLGPNGAGKSTTLKIATGYISPTAGRVSVSGLDVTTHPLAVKRKLGYLPEHNPLYLDMYVHEYLHFSGRFYGLHGKALKAATARVVDMCQLTPEQNKKIGQLSKGYRQRVGLAQALLYEPEVLILDEPTTGLDPNQIVEVRQLIKDISKGRTVLFSTHIMQEVQAICDRVIIINHGRLVADDTLTNLLAGQAKQVLELEFEQAVDTNILQAFDGVLAVEEIAACHYRVELDYSHDARPAMMRLVSEKKLPLIGIKQKETTMEEVFNMLTKQQPHV